MKHAQCGCTQDVPSPKCEKGKELFTAASQAFQNIFGGMAVIARDERWTVYALARFAYIDHLNGWQEGDIKVQRRTGFWMIHARSCGQWIFQFGTKNDDILVAWLSDRGYHQYVQIKSHQPKKQLLGYYHKSNTKAFYNIEKRTSPPDSASTLQEDTFLSGEREMMEQREQAVASNSLFDLKTLVTIRIALLVAQFPKPLTIVDRLLVQRRAADFLRVHGVQVGVGDERTLGELIDEAIQQKEIIRGSVEQGKDSST